MNWTALKNFYNRHKFLIIASIVVILVGWAYKTLVTLERKLTFHIQPVSVTAVPVISKDMVVQFKAIGTMQAHSYVAVKSMIDGQITQVAFKRGQMVQKGQLLFVIDPRPSEAALAQAQANLARDQATLANFEAVLQRDQALVKSSYVSKATIDLDIANQKSAAANVQADQAAVENAQLQLEYSYIKSPVNGRTGDIQVYEGNVVKTSQGTTLVTINEVQPIDVSFAVPQQYFSIVQSENSSGNPLVVTATINKNEVKQGQLTFVDNQINTSTGTINLKATFPNTDLRLWPGQFAEVRLPTATYKNALVIPSIAVQQGQTGSYVYVVKSDSTASYRSITIGPIVGDETIVEKGLSKGETVVTSGQLQIADGTPVKVVEAKANVPVASGKSK